MRKLVLFAAAAALFGGACSDDPKRPPVTETGGRGSGAGSGSPVPEDAPGGETPDSGAACTELPNTGAVIDQNELQSSPPAGTGGVIADGVYDMTDAVVYRPGGGGLGGPTGVSYQGTIRITAPRFERVLAFQNQSGASSELRSAGSISTTGTTGTIVLTCPTPSQEQFTYSVVNDTLTISNLVTNESFVFARQL